MSLITDIAAKLDTILADPALTSSLRASCPAFAAIMVRADAETARHQRPAPQPLPAISLMTSLQMTYFDNGKTSRGERYAVQIEAWTDNAKPSERAIKVSSSVLTRETLQGRLKRWRVSGLDDWRDTLLTVLEAFQGDEWRFVPLTSKAIGTTYLADQLVVIKMDGQRVADARLFVGGETMTLIAFTDRDAKGAKLKAAAKWSVRFCATGNLSTWATQLADVSDD